jgi:hypothetical protein
MNLILTILFQSRVRLYRLQHASGQESLTSGGKKKYIDFRYLAGRVMLRRFLISFLIIPITVSGLGAEDLPEPFLAYQKATNSRSIENYMELFSPDMVMIDVGRSFDSPEEIRRWAMREVIPQGETFRYLRTLTSREHYWMTRVRWLSFEALYYFWTNEANRIRKMSLQYPRVGETPSQEVYAKLPSAVQLYFDGIRSGMDGMLEEAFTASPNLNVVNRDFAGREGILRFARNEVYGGEYELVELLQSRIDFVSLHLRFKPKNWSQFEPDAIYDFSLKDGLIQRMDLQYK